MTTRFGRFVVAAGLLCAPLIVSAQGGQRGAAPTAPAQPQAGGRGRGAIQVMTLTSTAWTDGGMIPAKYTQAGDEMSPPLSWSNVPQGATGFVLVAHDLDAPIGTSGDDILHWLVWNIPAMATSLPEHVPALSQLPDGMRQISATAPGYRGPGAPAAGPAHHYVFELYATDGPVDVPAVGASPPLTRAAVMAALSGHVRGKAVLVGLFKRQG